MSEPTQPSGTNPGVPGTGEPQRPIPPGYYSGQGVPPGYHPGYTAQPGYHPGYAVHPGYHPGYGQPGHPYAGQPQPPLTVPPRPKEVTRAGWLLIISAVLQVAVFALMMASFTGSTSAVSVGMFALAGTGIYLVVAVALNFFLRSGFRFARIIAAGMAAMSLLGTSNSFIFGPAAGVVSLLAVAAWAGAAVLLFQRPANEFFRGSWAARRARLLNRF
ncbi:hypothetical protein [Arthrobacter sp. 08Y14]|uniref:hypothetical protein n=1 Tax=Arthrobacter sp. 08Y14 TaxID=2058885 RepID=UPI000CE32256|nr:hypothetical protein [Arthrobacter sp. 08Y14]